MVDWEFILKTIVRTSAGIPVTIKLVLVSLIVSCPFAFLNAVVLRKPEKHPIMRKLLAVYFSFVRSTPVIIVIFLLYHTLPLAITALLRALGSDFNIYKMDDIVYGYVVFTFVSIPWLSEVFRAGLAAVPASQVEAAKSVGMTGPQAYLHIVIPQALTACLPVLATFVTNLIKLTSPAFAMSIQEITGIARIASADSIRYVECYLVIFFMYLILCLVAEQIFKFFERRSARRLSST